MHLSSKSSNLCLAIAHVSRNHCAIELCTHALCTCCQLWSALQYLTLSLWSNCISPTDHATIALWAPRSQVQFMRSTPSHESCPEISSWDYSCMSPHLTPAGIAACTPSAHLAWNFSAWVVLPLHDAHLVATPHPEVHSYLHENPAPSQASIACLPPASQQ